MTSDDHFEAQAAVRVMLESECWERLGAAALGRVAISVGGDVDIFPVNFVVADGAIFFRTAPGSKLLGLTASPKVAFEIDGYDDETAYSVVVKGEAERVERQSEIDAADRLPLKPWIPTLKYRWVKIWPERISGRGFLRAAEPERY